VSAETLGGANPPSRTEDRAVQARAESAVGAEGFFRADGDALVPAAFASSPWGQVLHGRLIGGLTARAAEQTFAGTPEMTCSRLTVDLFRSVPLEPLQVTTRTVRAGRRIAVLEVTVEQHDVPVGQGRAVLLRRSEQPGGTFRPAPAWDASVPSRLGPPRSTATRQWTAPWESWLVGAPAWPDSPGGTPAGGLWIRDVHPLITGEQLTPLQRAAMAADLANPVSNFSDRGLSFINADYTLYLGREPQGEHVGIQPAGHISDAGLAAGHCVLHDLRGPVGFVTVAAVANPTMGS